MTNSTFCLKKADEEGRFGSAYTTPLAPAKPSAMSEEKNLQSCPGGWEKQTTILHSVQVKDSPAKGMKYSDTCFSQLA